MALEAVILPKLKSESTPTSTAIPQIERAEWESISLRKRQARDNAIRVWDTYHDGRILPNTTNVRLWPLECGELTDREASITDTLPSQLLESLSRGELTSEETLRAFIKRTILAHHLTNPLTEVMFDRALQRARDLDQYLQVHGKTVGPFHGLPMSLKDIVQLEGTDTTLGYVGMVGNQPQRSDTLAELLWKGGAVFYCKTNVPQTLMSGECFNYVFGRTTSPWNTTTSAGGSSGGEGSLVALGGSPIGVGSDIGGSINTPASHNGVYGLCPSTQRFPLHGPHNSFQNLVIGAVGGPLSRSIDGLETYTRGVLALSPWETDASCLKLPWDQSEYECFLGLERKLCFGIVHNDGVVTPHPPIQRGMRETIAALQVDGHEVVELPGFLETVSDRFEKSILDIFNARGDDSIRKIIARFNEPLSPEIVLPKATDRLDVDEYLKAGNRVLALRQKYLERWCDTAKISPTGRPVDVILLPSGGHVSPPHGTMTYLLYEAISNLFDWTCATIPVGVVDQVLDLHPGNMDFQPLSREDSLNWAQYSPDKYENVPICLQVLGQRHTEERVLGCLRAIERALDKQRGEKL